MVQSEEEEGVEEEDDLEYLTLDLVNILPPEAWNHLLTLLRSREDRASDMTRRNIQLRKEIKKLRTKVTEALPPVDSSDAWHDAESVLPNSGAATVAAAVSAVEAPAPPLLATEASAQDPGALPYDSSPWAADRADLERRVAALAAERRGEAVVARDALDEDLQEAASETLEFLRQTEAAAGDLPRLLATLAQWLNWASRGEDAPKGARTLLAQVPEEVLQQAYRGAAAKAEASAGLGSDRFGDLPACGHIAFAALAALPDNGQAIRVGLACLALGGFAAEGRQALLESACDGLRAALVAAARRPHHPEVQGWAFALLASAAEDLPNDSQGASVAWEGVVACAGAFRTFHRAPWVLERAAHALSALLRAHPRRAFAAAQGKNLRAVLSQFTGGPMGVGRGREGFAFTASPEAIELLRARIAEALAELERAAMQSGGSDREESASFFSAGLHHRAPRSEHVT